MMRKLFFLIFFLIAASSFVFSYERILSFHSDILVLATGELEITESITVKAEGNEIKRGIFRDLPSHYQNKYGLRHKVEYNFKEILRDGQPEQHFVKKSGPGFIRIYIGNENIFLSHGYYTYTIKYTTNYQIFLEDEFDALYWNVNGNNWSLPIETLSTCVTLPEGSKINFYEAYTGFEEEKQQNYESYFDDRRLCFTTTTVIYPYQGMTIHISIEKGIIKEYDKTKKLIADNINTLIAIIGLIGLLVMYIIIWLRIGVDPPKGIIIPQFEIPKNYSPAIIRYIYKMRFDNTVFSSAIIGLAVKKFLSIDEVSKNLFILRKIKDPENLSKTETLLMNLFFIHDFNIFEIGKANDPNVKIAIDKLKNNLNSDIKSGYFKTNGKYLIFPILFSIGMILLSFISLGFEQIFMSIFIILWSFACYAAINGLINSFSQQNTKSTLLLGFITIPFVLIWIGLLFLTVHFGGSLIVLALHLLYILVNVLFAYLIKAPTINGREIMDKIEGLRMFIRTTNIDEIGNFFVEDRIQIYEKYLPYAIALDCEQIWTKKFERLISAAISNNSYQPSWNRSYATGISASSFSSNISSGISRAVSTSSTSPSSGGGSSGGGRGGGGGGGW